MRYSPWWRTEMYTYKNWWVTLVLDIGVGHSCTDCSAVTAWWLQGTRQKSNLKICTGNWFPALCGFILTSCWWDELSRNCCHIHQYRSEPHSPAKEKFHLKQLLCQYNRPRVYTLCMLDITCVAIPSGGGGIRVYGDVCSLFLIQLWSERKRDRNQTSWDCKPILPLWCNSSTSLPLTYQYKGEIRKQ